MTARELLEEIKADRARKGLPAETEDILSFARKVSPEYEAELKNLLKIDCAGDE